MCSQCPAGIKQNFSQKIKMHQLRHFIAGQNICPYIWLKSNLAKFQLKPYPCYVGVGLPLKDIFLTNVV